LARCASAHQCVEHDDVNVMCIGAQIVGPWLAKDLVAAYLDATFSTDEEFRRRVANSRRWMRGVEIGQTLTTRSRATIPDLALARPN
jgi:ribose 5-phosphate isomerase RpiB